MAGRGGQSNIAYEIQVCANGNWMPFGMAGSPVEAERDARTALSEKKYLEGYKIICERRDSRSGKINKIAFAPVLREELDAEADRQWRNHVDGKPPESQRRQRKPSAMRRHLSWIIPVLVLMAILWGAYFALDFTRSAMFQK